MAYVYQIFIWPKGIGTHHYRNPYHDGEYWDVNQKTDSPYYVCYFVEYSYLPSLLDTDILRQ